MEFIGIRSWLLRTEHLERNQSREHCAARKVKARTQRVRVCEQTYADWHHQKYLHVQTSAKLGSSPLDAIVRIH